MVKESEEKPDIIEHLQLIFVELPKFKFQSSDAKQLRLLWLRFLREIDENTGEVSKDLLSIPEIAEAVVLCEEAAYTKGELSSYKSYWDSVRTEKTLLLGRFEEGMAEGITKGKLEGKLEIALNMLKEQEPLDKISKFTGLSIQELKNLKI